MTTYKVLSNKLALGKQGETIDSDLLDGCNIQALVDGGHIAEVNAKVLKKEITEETEK
jgi:hypothetical protein